MMKSLTYSFSWIASHWRTSVAIAGTVGIATVLRHCLETDEARARRVEHNRKKELQRLADNISTYGRNLRQRYPTGDVVVSEHDLAERLRKRHDVVSTALHILLGEQKVQKSPLSGYWRLNV